MASQSPPRLEAVELIVNCCDKNEPMNALNFEDFIVNTLGGGREYSAATTGFNVLIGRMLPKNFIYEAAALKARGLSSLDIETAKAAIPFRHLLDENGRARFLHLEEVYKEGCVVAAKALKRFGFTVALDAISLPSAIMDGLDLPH